MKNGRMNRKHLHAVVETPEEVADLLLQALETEMGGADVYRTALKCVHNERLREEWSGYLAQAEKHVHILQDACERLGIDPELEPPGRRAVRSTGRALVRSLRIALKRAPADAIEAVASDCVALAGTKDPSSWGALDRREPSEPLELEGWSRAAWLPQPHPDGELAARPTQRTHRANEG